jgi:subtilase family serine protease
VTVAGLAAGAAQAVTFMAPRCAPGDVLRFEVDPDDRVAEEDERDNVLTVACPI